MNCPQCGHTNPEGRLDCNLCGEHLTILSERQSTNFIPVPLIFTQFLILLFLLYFGSGLTIYLTNLTETGQGYFVIPSMLSIIGIKHTLRLAKTDIFERLGIFVLIISGLTFTLWLHVQDFAVEKTFFPQANFAWIGICVYSLYTLLFNQEIKSYFKQKNIQDHM